MTFREALDRKPADKDVPPSVRDQQTKSCLACGTAFHRRRYEHMSHWDKRLYCSRPCSHEGAKWTRERFWSKVNKDTDSGCWEWTGNLSSGKYGSFGSGGRTFRAHRFAYEDHYGVDPSGMNVCHTCDNPLCVNPDHLWLGSDADNSLDMRLKGRAQRKLTAEQVIQMRRQHAEGGAYHRELAEQYGVHRTVVTKILRREVWRHV